MKKFSIYSQVAEFPAQHLEDCRSLEQAEARIRTYERQDRYEVEVEGYGFPYGLPKYFIK